MIGYVTLGTNKFDEAAKFYDELLAEGLSVTLPDLVGRIVVDPAFITVRNEKRTRLHRSVTDGGGLLNQCESHCVIAVDHGTVKYHCEGARTVVIGVIRTE